MDIVIPLGTDTAYNDYELKYALRSIQKHCHNYRKVVVIGKLPPFLRVGKKLECIEIEDYGQSAAYNIMVKLTATKYCKIISDNFLYSNDDIFFTKDVDITHYPVYYSHIHINRIIARTPITNTYSENLESTKDILISKQLDMKYYDCHHPIIFDKHKLFDTLRQEILDWDLFDYCIKTIYCAFNPPKNPILITDCKLAGHKTTEMIYAEIGNKPVFSIDNSMLSLGQRSPLIKVWNELYPEPFVHEIN